MVIACRNAFGVSPAQRLKTCWKCDGESPTWPAIASTEGWSRQRVEMNSIARLTVSVIGAGGRGVGLIEHDLVLTSCRGRARRTGSPA